VTISESRDFYVTVLRTTHYHISGLRIDFKISSISIYAISTCKENEGLKLEILFYFKISSSISN
jgi:hypothetical protein